MIRIPMLRPEKMMDLICSDAETLHRSAAQMQENGLTALLERFLPEPRSPQFATRAKKKSDP